MSKDAWLHALRSDPSPLFKEQLRARLRAEDEPARRHLAVSGPGARWSPRRRWS